MFKGSYQFKGMHATKAKQLIAPFNEKQKLFNHMHEVYTLAPIVGFLYGIMADVDNSSDDTTNIFAEQIISRREDLIFSFRLIMLLDDKYEPDIQKRLDYAFRYVSLADPESPVKLNLEHYNKYVLGGVDKLFEKLIEPSGRSDSYIENLYLFIEEATERWKLSDSSEKVKSITELARF